MHMVGDNLDVMEESHVEDRVFFKDSNIILKYNILSDCFGLKKTCL